MTHRSSHTVTYSDLIKLAERAQFEAEDRLSGARSRGVMNLEALRHDVETARTLVRMLKKCERGKQADLFELYRQVK